MNVVKLTIVIVVLIALVNSYRRAGSNARRGNAARVRYPTRRRAPARRGSRDTSYLDQTTTLPPGVPRWSAKVCIQFK